MRNGAIVLILAILVAFGGWYIFNHSQTNLSTNTSGDKQIKENSEYYSIQVMYPSTTRLATRTDSTTQSDSRATATIERELDSIVKQFKNAVNQSLSNEEKDRLKAASTTYALDVGYHAYNSGSFTSYEFDIYQDIGGAHPNNSFMTLVFNLKGDKVALGDLFSDPRYLDRISAEAKKQITAQIERAAGKGAAGTIVAEGIAPTEDNFKNWVDNDGILIFFIPPSQAAAYAAGPFEVRIPLDDLKDILKPHIQ